MYTKHFGLNMLPFENVPDPKFFFDQGEHARIHNHIKDSLDAGRGLTVVTGPIGSGKTTLSQMIIADFSDVIKLIWMAEPPDTSIDLFLYIAQELGITLVSAERTFVIRDIRDALLKINSAGSKCLVIIDESHLMSDDTVNGIRLLNNLEVGSIKLIQVLLLGQEEIMEIIKRPEMEPFKQRIATLENMGRMNSERISQYVTHRIQIAGGEPSLLTETGWESLMIALGKENIPRVINSLCDRSFTAAFEKEKAEVDVDDVYEAAQGMGLQKEVFFYKMSLKQRGKEKQAPSAGEDVSTTEPETSSKVRVADSADMQQNKQKPAQTHQWPQKTVMPETEKSLKVPASILSFSIGTLIFSVFFYCGKSGSSSVVGCLMELLGL